MPTRKPRQLRRARDKVAGLLKRLRERSRRQRGKARPRIGTRKAALALSAGVMGISTAAMSVPSPAPRAQAPPAGPVLDRRLPTSLLRASDEMKRALIEEEGVRYTVYRDVAGYPTVGVGHLVRPEDNLRVGDRISRDRALDFLEEDLRIAERGVRRLVGDLHLFQHEFDALVDLVFNVGEGNVSPLKSPQLNAAIAAGDYFAMAEQLGYHYAGGRIARGLIHRSDRRAQIFTMADYENTRPGAKPGDTI